MHLHPPATGASPTCKPPKPDQRSVKTSSGSVPYQASTLKRLLNGCLGLLMIAIALIGAVLPGIPTTGPLIAGSFFLAKSNPRLERKLVGLKIFAPYRHYLDGSAALPKRARIFALVAMWSSILVSSCLLSQASTLRETKIAATLAMGCVGTVVISRYRREVAHTPGETETADSESSDPQNFTRATAHGRTQNETIAWCSHSRQDLSVPATTTF